MKYVFALLMVFNMSFAHSAAMERVECASSDKNPEVIYKTVNTGSQEITLKLCEEYLGQDSFYIADSITIKSKSGTLSQVINIERSPDGPDQIRKDQLDKSLSTEDIDFDGNNDIKILRTCGATGNCFYLYWLYSAVSGVYNEIPNKEIENNELTNPSANNELKLVCTHGNAGYPQSWSSCYKWQGINLVIVSEVKTYYDESLKKVMKSIRTYENGILKVQQVEEVKESQ